MENSQRRPYDRTSYILVVDDDNTLLKFFKIHLNKFFSRVIVVKNAKEAIDTLRDRKIDMVITDVRMPRMDGLQLMKKIRKFDPSVPVMIISGALLTEVQLKACEEDADGYLRKPFTVDALHEFIDSGMERREKLLQLSELLSDPKSVREVISGKIKYEKLTDEENRGIAEELINHLKIKLLLSA